VSNLFSSLGLQGPAHTSRNGQTVSLQEEWFRSWFDSPYYSMLYRHRDDAEAQYFINQLLAHVQLPPGATVLDLACGTGRHAIYLNQLGYDVTGVDLSHAKIEQAKQYESERLHFLEGDIRHLECPWHYDLVLNLFTSLGYFKDLSENQQVLHGIRQAMQPEGMLVIDFFNATWLEQHITPYHEQDLNGVHFEIKKRIENGAVEKLIRITDGDRMYCFKEHVQLLHLRDFEKMLRKEHLKLEQVWGDYHGAPFHEADSQRMVLFARKSG